MRQHRSIMGMPVIIEVVDDGVTQDNFDQAFSFLTKVDEQFSPFKPTSEVSRFARGELQLEDTSLLFREIMKKSEDTKRVTDGYFDVFAGGKFDPSGLVKGWAIQETAKLLRQAGFKNIYVEAGGDIQVYGHSANQQPWRVGIRHPVQHHAVVKVVSLTNAGIATSGTYEKGKHIFNPKTNQPVGDDIISLTVIGPNVYEADRFATAAFAMGAEGINVIQMTRGLEGYMIDRAGLATETTGFHHFVVT